MFEAGGGFRFTTKTFQMRFGGPMAQADHFERDDAIQTLLLARDTPHPGRHDRFPPAIHSRQSRRTSLPTARFLFICVLHRPSSAAGVIDPGYRFVREQIKSGLKQARGTKTFRCVGKNFRSALSTNPRCAAHDARVGCALLIMYCADFWHTLRSQHSD